MKKKDIIDRNIFINSGKKGGTTTAKRGRGFYQAIGKKGGIKRWSNKAPKLDVSEDIKDLP